MILKIKNSKDIYKTLAELVVKGEKEAQIKMKDFSIWAEHDCEVYSQIGISPVFGYKTFSEVIKNGFDECGIHITIVKK